MARRSIIIFKKNSFGYQQYIECLDPISEEPGSTSIPLTPRNTENFEEHVSMPGIWTCGRELMVQPLFENLMMIMAGQQPESCNMRASAVNSGCLRQMEAFIPADFMLWISGDRATSRKNSFEEMDENG